MATSTRRSRHSSKAARTRQRPFPIARRIGRALAKTTQAVGQLLTGTIDVEFDSLRDLYIRELRDLYSAEHQLVEALPKMSQAAHSRGLKNAFQAHLKETRGHVKRLETIFSAMGLPPKEEKCKAMAGLVAEGNEWTEEKATAGVMDAGLIAAARRVEHYEMAGYGCVRNYAKLLGESNAAQLLQQTLNEEGGADRKLTELAKQINIRAETEQERKAAKRSGAKTLRHVNGRVKAR
jgi:ferritin-like metal-binding protein YciE